MLWLEWQFLIFLLPIGLAILYVLMMSFGLGGGEDGVDVGHDFHVDVGHDVHVDVGHDVDAGHDLHPGDAAHTDHPGVFASVLSLLGVGKVPLSILIVSAFLIWGGVGVMLNLLFGMEAIVKTIAFAGLATVAGTRLIAEGLSTLLPSEESYHTPKQDLVGEVGEVLYEVTATSGAVRLCDPSGNLLDLESRTAGDAPIKPGSRVVLTDYDPSTDVFFVDVTPAGKEILS